MGPSQGLPRARNGPRYVPFSVGEGRDRHLTVVLAQAAGLAGGLDLEVLEVFDARKRRLTFTAVVHAGSERRAVSAHKSGDIGANNLAAGEQLECAKHRIVQECSALNDDALAQIRGVLEL